MKDISKTGSKVWLRSTQGAVAIEFALVSMVFLYIVMAIIDFSIIVFLKTSFENVGTMGARVGKTGQTSSTETREQLIKDKISEKLSFIVDPTKLNVTISSYPTFDSIGKAEPCIHPATAPCPGTPGVNFVDSNGNGIWDDGNGIPSAGGPGAVVVYTVSYPWHLLTPLMGYFIGSNGVYTVSSSTAVRNEPF